MQLLNIPLGGNFASRINMNLREKNGYTLWRQFAVHVPPRRRLVPGR